MISAVKKTPLICLIISIIRLLRGKLRFSRSYLDTSVEMENGKKFVIFRHITTFPVIPVDDECVFIVSFKFARLSHKANKLTSIIPMLMITGFPGFVAKMYAVNPDDGYWQGMYQWKSINHLEEYKKSFVFKMMNRRAIQETIKSVEIINQNLIDVIENKRVNI